MPTAISTIEAVLGREVVEVTGVQEQRIDDALLDALEAGERVPGDDVSLVGHPDELRCQYQRRRHGHRGQHQQVGQPAAHRMPSRVKKPPGQQEQDDDEPAGQVHRQDADQRQHGHRDAIAMPQRRGDQHKRRDRDPVGREVGHCGDAELDVGHRRERRRQRSRGGRRPGGDATGWSSAEAETRSASPRWTETARPMPPPNSRCSRWWAPPR